MLRGWFCKTEASRIPLMISIFICKTEQKPEGHGNNSDMNRWSHIGQAFHFIIITPFLLFIP